MAETAFQKEYRQAFIHGFEDMESRLRKTVTTNVQVKGNEAIFLVADSGSATAKTRGVNGLIPARADSLTQNTATLAEWHDLPRKTGFNVFASQGDQKRIMQETSMAVLNRKIDDDIIAQLDTATNDAGSTALKASLDMVVWALSFSMQPYEDTQVIRNRVARLDPSGALPSHQGDPQEAFPGRQGTSAILIDATRKKLYPPVGLPKREYMERALRLWEQSEMPKLKLHTPWHGYHLGRWSEDAEENAQLLVHGEYRKLGEKMAKRQTPVLDPKPW